LIFFENALRKFRKAYNLLLLCILNFAFIVWNKNKHSANQLMAI